MYINQQALNIVGVTYEEYLDWCLKNNKVAYKKKTRQEFFTKIKNGQIVRSMKTHRLINKYPKEKENKE